MSAISELNVFSGRDTVEDRARSCLNKVKSAWEEQPVAVGRNSWVDCELNTVDLELPLRGSTIRSDGSPLEYLHRLTALGLRAKQSFKTGTPAAL
ncbi:hypothetical protein PHMEG_0006994 [Phytophthora megakarya]|uniref:Uncharacterized protein n=1 Tax=Phytophthora megakarya TaxID=4795 RepID=A0A225WMM9_9STRA|nr:hypothetical protein PHMEG_0006994 [Phytophthora megakarya]